MSFLGGGDAESDESLHQLIVNEHYAKAFQYKKEREELNKLKEKYGSDYEGVDGDDSDSDETEDEDGEELTPAVDAAILRTLSLIQKKDPAIYDSNQSVFEEEAKHTAASTPWGHRAIPGKSKPLTLQQQKVQSLLSPRSPSPTPQRPTHVEEQRALRDETINAFHLAVSGDGDGDGDLLTLREKSKDELEHQEEYRAFLEREVGDVESLVRITNNLDGQDIEKSADIVHEGVLKRASKKRKDRSLASDEQFLMNYILNRGWIDRQSRHLPTYSEITGHASGSIAPVQPQQSSGASSGVIEGPPRGPRELAEDGAEVPDVDELEEFDEVADAFESTYNFRFEEPEATIIQSHPRQVASTVRREDAPRKEARERKKARKEEALARKNEEVKRLKALKLREIREKLNIVSKESGFTAEELEVLDIEGEWDPEKHDAQMANLYNADANAAADDRKPAWDEDIDLSDIAPSEKKSRKQRKKEERRKAKAATLTGDDIGVDVDAMDADATPARPLDSDDGEEWDGTEEMRKRKLHEYMDKLHKLDFNDIVGGDLPTRFKYAPVQKSNFNISAAEILMATDAELNDYTSLKKLAPYRKPKGRDRWDGKQAERLESFREKVRSRARASQWSSSVVDETKKKRKGRKERGRARVTAAVVVPDGGAGSDLNTSGATVNS